MDRSIADLTGLSELAFPTFGGRAWGVMSGLASNASGLR